MIEYSWTSCRITKHLHRKHQFSMIGKCLDVFNIIKYCPMILMLLRLKCNSTGTCIPHETVLNLNTIRSVMWTSLNFSVSISSQWAHWGSWMKSLPVHSFVWTTGCGSHSHRHRAIYNCRQISLCITEMLWLWRATGLRTESNGFYSCLLCLVSDLMQPLRSHAPA